jgi:F-box and WD-40 domain protein CDC4
MRAYALNLGGKRVVVQEDNVELTAKESAGQMSGPGWRRTLLSESAIRADDERLGLVQAINRATGKEVKKRPHKFSRVTGGIAPTSPVPTEASGSRHRSSPPRKKIRGRDDPATPYNGTGPLLSPLPSPEQELPPSASSNNAEAPMIGSGLEVAALFSLPSLVSHFEGLPDKLQQQLLMSLLRRSRMPTIQRVSAFAGLALKRDFVSQLPQEVAVQILKNVDVRSLTAASRVNTKWRKMIDSERTIWQQRLVDDGLYYGLGVEEEDESLVTRRFETIDWKEKNKPSEAGTPSEDEPMGRHLSPLPVPLPKVERPHPLKHVYRRRYTASRSWLNSRPEHYSFPGHGTNVVTCLQFDADKIVSASDDHSINVYDTATGVLKKRLDGHEGGVWAMQYKNDTLVSGSTDRTIRIWDLEALVEAHVFHGHTSTVRCLQIVEPVLDPATGEYQPPYPMLVTGSRDSTLRVWKLPKKGEPAVVKIPVSRIMITLAYGFRLAKKGMMGLSSLKKTHSIFIFSKDTRQLFELWLRMVGLVYPVPTT